MPALSPRAHAAMSSPPLPAPSRAPGAPAPGLGPSAGGILLLAAGLRFAFLGRHSLWSDEMFVVWVSRFSWHDLFSVVRAVDFHPPLYYALMKAWIGLAGTGEAALRAPSAVFSVLGVWLTYALARRVSSEQVSLLGALLVATAPFHVMAGQEARMYPLLGALALGSTLTVVTAVARGGVLRWGLYTVLSALMVYTSYLGVLVIAAHAVWIFGWERRRLRWWLTTMGGIACLYAPWLPSLWVQIGQARAYDQLVALQDISAASASGAARVGDVLALFAFGGSLFGTSGYFTVTNVGPSERLVVLLPFLAMIAFGVASAWADRSRLAPLGLPLVVPITAVAVLSIVKPIFVPRWFSFLAPFWAMLLALGIVELARSVRNHPGRFAAWCTVGLLLYAVPVLHRYYLEPSTWSYRWRDAAAAAADSATPNDLFLYVDTPAEQTFEYYFHTPHASLMLAPSPNAGAAMITPAQALRLARYHRVWLVVNGPVTSRMRQTLLPALNPTFQLAASYDFAGAALFRFDARRAPGP
jgi:4-amino-4-deoxy-L-arabinose transferase-like glycosyltransferase